ncbi:conserved hypothetical protein [Mesorhizobium delmotii]|uniref:Uncharacterized protein n=1 Tax=Mesorhizobium delmotii TaxID=1631247 RepID=A0A2P9ATR7_9HYPH|nr:conserved hypothetical protein [Mesorhizobium delmotii]
MRNTAAVQLTGKSHSQPLFPFHFSPHFMLQALERRASTWTHKVRSKTLNLCIVLPKIDDFRADATEGLMRRATGGTADWRGTTQ